jgi:aromatic ring-opening dioxygenase catalytic subunit (LigB family)
VTSNTATITAVNLTNALLIYQGITQADNTIIGTEALVRLALTNATTITGSRGAAGNAGTRTVAFTVMGNPRPPMIYDYGGFPEHTYSVRYDAPGSPELARRVQALIESAGLPARVDAERGFDHGTFSPMAAIYPKADVPVVQLSLRRGLDPAEHIALGRAIAPLREENVLISAAAWAISLRQFGPQSACVKAFDDWLDDAVVATTPQQRLSIAAVVDGAGSAHRPST